MPIETSMYQNVGKMPHIQAPSISDAMAKGMNLRQMAMQQERMAKQGEADDQAAKHQAHLQKASVFGNALESMAGMSPQERVAAYPQVRAGLIQSGVLGEQDAPPEHDEGFYRQSLMKFRGSKEGMDRQLQQSQIAKNFADAKQKGSADPMTQFEQKLAMKDRYKQVEDEREMRRYSNVQGWTVADGATPTKDDAKSFKASVTASAGMEKSLARLQELTDQHGTEVWPGQVKGEMGQLARDIQLQAKELYNLGVLNGPDMSLLETVITNPTSATEFFNPEGNARASAGLKHFGEMMRNRVGSQASVLGFTQNKQSAVAQEPKKKSAGSWLDSQEANASPPIKHGTEEDGFVFMGGDPANPKSWKKAR